MGLWDNFKYCIMLEFYEPKTKKLSTCYVTEVNNGDKTFKYKTVKEIQSGEAKPLSFGLEQAVDLMNCIYCNGYDVAIKPYLVD